MKENEAVDFDALEEVHVTMEKDAFQPSLLHCSVCKIKMKKTEIEVQVDQQLYLRLQGFECSKCHKKYLGIDEAKKMDKALIFNRVLQRDFKMERNLSFDGDNYLFRILKEFTQNIHKKKIEIVPLGAKEFCAVVG